MAKFIAVVRNNWKKSTVGTCAIVYGFNYGYEKYKVEQVMRSYCEEAVKYGEVPVPATLKPRNITVVLNPAANKKKAKANFEKYCAPLLHLAGFSVEVVQTESEGQARSLAAQLDKTDLIVVAGGDGTLSETITGLMRAHGCVSCPVGVLPLGRTNTTACALLGLGREGAVSPEHMAAAAMAIVRGHTKYVDSIRVDVIQTEGEEGLSKPVFGLSGVKWGAYRDALSRQDKYWYVGALRSYLAVLLNAANAEPVTGHVTFTHACAGCSRCYDTRKDLHPSQQWRWYHYLLPSFTSHKPDIHPVQVDYQKLINTQCGVLSEMDLTGLDICISCPCVCPGSKGITVSSGPEQMSWVEFVSEGWRRVQGKQPAAEPRLQAQQLQIIPKLKDQESEDSWFSIDNEEFEVRPIRVTLVPKSIQVFYPEDSKT